MNVKLILLIGTLAALPVQAQMAAQGPQLGFIKTHNGSVRALYGLPANLMWGDPVHEEVQQAAFSSAAGLLQMGRGVFLETLDGALLGSFTPGERFPLLGITASKGSGKTDLAGHAAVWMPQQNKLALWDGARFVIVRTDPLPGSAVSITPISKQMAALLVRVNGDGLHRIVIDGTNGQLVSDQLVSSGASAGYEQNGSLLLVGPAGLTATDARGFTQTLAWIPEQVAVASIGDEWVSAEEPGIGRVWLLHLKAGLPAELPLEASEAPAPAPSRHRVSLRIDNNAAGSH